MPVDKSNSHEWEASMDDEVKIEEGDKVIIRIQHPSDDADLNKRLMINFKKDVVGD